MANDERERVVNTVNMLLDVANNLETHGNSTGILLVEACGVQREILAPWPYPTSLLIGNASPYILFFRC